MKKIKRIISGILVVAMCFTLNLSVFATELPSSADSEKQNEAVSGENYEVMPLGTGSISGYAYKRLTKSDPVIIVPLQASGFGGMGITVRTSSSYSGTMYCQGVVISSSLFEWVDGFKGDVTSNGETYFKGNHFGGDGLEFVIALEIPEGVSVDVWVWVYG